MRRYRVTPHMGLVGPKADISRASPPRLGPTALGYDEPQSQLARKARHELAPGENIGVTQESREVGRKIAKGRIAGMLTRKTGVKVAGEYLKAFANPNVIDLAPVGDFPRAQEAADVRRLRKKGVRYRGGKV